MDFRWVWVDFGSEVGYALVDLDWVYRMKHATLHQKPKYLQRRGVLPLSENLPHPHPSPPRPSLARASFNPQLTTIPPQALRKLPPPPPSHSPPILHTVTFPSFSKPSLPLAFPSFSRPSLPVSSSIYLSLHPHRMRSRKPCPDKVPLIISQDRP